MEVAGCYAPGGRFPLPSSVLMTGAVRPYRIPCLPVKAVNPRIRCSGHGSSCRCQEGLGCITAACSDHKGPCACHPPLHSCLHCLFGWPSLVLCAQGAAYVCGAEALLAVGGAHAIAAMAYGIGQVCPRLSGSVGMYPMLSCAVCCLQVPACDVVVGPGNKWVTAAKQLVSGRVGIDMLAGVVVWFVCTVAWLLLVHCSAILISLLRPFRAACVG